MDYGEAYDALEEFVNSDKYQEFSENLSGNNELTPDLEVFTDRAVFYVQVYDTFNDEFERKVLAEYREGELGPVPFTEEQLDETLQGRGEIEIDESVLEPRDINFSEQRHAR
jgi:hypothetical protein